MISGAVIPAGRGNGRLSVSSSGLLDIKLLSLFDGGTYTCRGRNSAGQAEKSVYLAIAEVTSCTDEYASRGFRNDKIMMCLGRTARRRCSFHSLNLKLSLPFVTKIEYLQLNINTNTVSVIQIYVELYRIA